MGLAREGVEEHALGGVDPVPGGGAAWVDGLGVGGGKDGGGVRVGGYGGGGVVGAWDGGDDAGGGEGAWLEELRWGGGW